MMKRLAGIFLLLAAVLSLQAAAPKGERIAVVNMETVFRQYFKSRIAADTLRQQSEVYRTYIMAEQDKLREVEKEMNAARDAAQNLALSAAERESKKQLFEAKEKELRQKKAALNRYMVERNRTLSNVEKNKRQEILADIRAEAAKQAVSGGYTFVLDSSGMTTSGIPAVLYAPPTADLTAKILKSLNAVAVPQKDPEKK
ncbi:MAG: OmpH family outer membrane protein [Lentisphaeria bacterium]|nr:OmpH family outer membrane protein [Lentisphaeria bacterium]